MLKLIVSTMIAVTLLAIPARAQTTTPGTGATEQPADTGKAGKAKSTRSKAKTETKTDTSAKTDTTAEQPKAKRAKTEPTKGQLAARERQKKCGEEWRTAKAAGKLEKGATWPKFWSACNTRLKAQGT